VAGGAGHPGRCGFACGAARQVPGEPAVGGPRCPAGVAGRPDRRGPGRIDRQKTWLWYWDLDRGGAAARAHHPYANPAFVFPEMLHTAYTPAGWVPEFADYLSLSFWTATAFSPTDVSAIKRWAKLLMMTEAAVSLSIGALVIARAINILQ
jgi:hypothetical protein